MRWSRSPIVGRSGARYGQNSQLLHTPWIGLFDDDWRPVLDDRVGPAFAEPLTSSFDTDGRATWHVQRGDVVYRVTVQP
jgi:hypothetical protein